MTKRLPVGPRGERGFALVMAVFALSFVLLVLLSALTMTQFTKEIINNRLRYQGQTINAANAGLVEGLDWFRRQPQPVTTFTPVRNLAASPPINDTDSVTSPVSINREFEISAPGRVWGRYEVRRGTAAAGTGVLDLTQNRGKTGTGRVWQLESEGIIYIQNDPSVAFDAAPNRVVARELLRSEIQRLSINLPANAAILCQRGSAITVGNTSTRVRVVGGSQGYGLGYPPSTGSPTITAGTPAVSLTGTPSAQTAGVTQPFTVDAVFGISYQELLSVADISATAVADLPNPLPRSMQIIVLNVGAGNTATFTNARRLTGSGILVVIGNLTIDPSSFSNWSGIVYVNGNYTQGVDSTVSGAIVVAGATSTVRVNGSSSDFAECYYDPFILNQVAQQIGQFRFSRKPYIPE